MPRVSDIFTLLLIYATVAAILSMNAGDPAAESKDVRRTRIECLPSSDYNHRLFKVCYQDYGAVYDAYFWIVICIWIYGKSDYVSPSCTTLASSSLNKQVLIG
jgi:hypothetical protein